MFRRRYKKRYTFLPFVIFRTFLSLAIFVALIAVGFNAFKQFSGFDLVKADLQKDLPTIAATLLSQLQIKLPDKLGNFKIGNDVAGLNNVPEKKPAPKAPFSFKFLLLADSHNDNDNLKKALAQTKGVSFVIGLGDYTDVGTPDELKAVKKVFDGAGLRYFVTAGDHDLWDSRNKGKEPTANFVGIFGSPYQSFSYKNARFLILYNADNYLGVSEGQRSWLKEELDRIKKEPDNKLTLAFVHEPLYHPSSIRGMGKVEPKLIEQAKEISQTLKDGGVKEIFAGDIHYFTQYSEPQTQLKMTTVGALIGVRNAQNPRYIVVSVYEDGNYGVEDVEVK